MRRIFFAGALVIVGLLGKNTIGEFVAGTLSDKRVFVNKDLLILSTGYFPVSARLFARLGEYEAGESEADLKSAQMHVQEAINLSPNNYRYRLLLAEIGESRGDRAAAEQAFSDALKLAPKYSEIHWKFANFLARAKRLEDSIEHFRIAADLNPTLFAATLDLVWTISNENVRLLSRIVEDNQKGQLKLALLLANKSRISEAAEIFSKIDRNVLLPAWESSSFFDVLISKGYSKLAYQLWLKMQNVKAADSANLIWNGDFENENDSVSTQFDWRIGKSDFARIGVDSSERHQGTGSLLVNFMGRDTTRLDNEVRHLVAARAEINYRLDFFVKTENFTSGENLRVAVGDPAGKRIAESETVSAGTTDWKRMSINFAAPRQISGDAAALFISVKFQPRYSYDKPARGRIWFDDFVLSEANGK